VQTVTGENDEYDYDELLSDAVSQHMSNMADVAPEQFEEIAASIVEVIPEAADDVSEALREWQENEAANTNPGEDAKNE
jgi:hypothetical protein